MADITELYKQRQALDAEIKRIVEEAERSGESIIIDGETIDGVWNIEGLLPQPKETDFFPTYRKDENGEVKEVGEISYDSLIDRFGGELDGKEEQILSDLQAKANEIIQTQIEPKVDEAETAASAAESAKTAIDAIKTDIDETVSGFDTSVEQATSSALSDISEAKDEAISALGSKMHVGYRAIIGDGVTKSFTITHNLGSQWVFCQIWFNDLSDKCYYKLQEIDSNSIKIDFDFAPPADSVDVRIVPNVRIEDPTASLPDDFTLTKEHIDDSVECTPEEMQALIAILG